MWHSLRGHNRHLHALINFVYLGLALLPWGIVLLASPRGFDRSDEAFYLLSSAYPHDITTTFSLFGVVLSPLYQMVGGSVTGFRWLGALLWLAVSTGVSWASLRLIAGKPPVSATDDFDRRRRFWLTLLLIAGSVLYYCLWLLTPSYNWLNLVGITLFWGGFLLWVRAEARTWAARFGAGLLAFAAALVFWAKPSSAALLTLYPLAALLLNAKQARRLLDWQTIAAGIAGLGIGLSVPLWSGFTPQQVLDILTRGVEHQAMMKPTLYGGILDLFTSVRQQIEQMLRENRYPASSVGLWLPLLIAAVILTHLPLSISRRRRWLRLVLGFGLSVNLFNVSFVLYENVGYWALNTVLLIAVYLLVGSYAERVLSGAGEVRWRRLAWLIPILGLIFVFMFGTNNRYADHSGMAAYFYLMGCASLFLTVRERTVNATVLSSALPTLFLCVIGLTYASSVTPYRQDVSVWNMQQTVSVHTADNRLIVSAELARYITAFQTLARDAGWQPDTPLIDLTGRTPGMAYLLRGRAYGFPWLLSTNPGSDDAAIYILRQWQPEQLAAAWILSSQPGSRSALSTSVLTTIGLNFPVDYVMIGTVPQPASGETHTLWKPAG